MLLKKCLAIDIIATPVRDANWQEGTEHTEFFFLKIISPAISALGEWQGSSLF